MTVSAIVPLYNKAGQIQRALQSILSQNTSVDEIVVVDDGSSDGGADLVERVFGSHVRLLRQPHAGVSAARNRGIRTAKSDYIALLDADDEWKPGFITRIHKLIKAFPESGLYGTGFLRQPVDGTIIVPHYRGIPHGHWEGIIPDYFDSSMTNSPICSSSAVVPKQVFTRVGFYNENISINEDIHLWGRIALVYPVCYSSECLAIVHEDSDNRSHLRKHMLEPHYSYLTDFQYLLGEAIRLGNIDRIKAASVRQFIAKKKIEAAVLYLKNRVDGKKARQLLLQAINTRHYRKRLLMGLALSYLPTRILRTIFRRRKGVTPD
jgi:glycosyltransferase involved in cell wall biosynthesis